MLRKLSVVVSAVALLGVSAALPASAAVNSSHPKPHNFSIPGVTGISAWGSYLKSGGKVKVTVCVKDTSSSILGGAAVGVAFSKSGKDKSVGATVLGDGHSSCRSMTTAYTAHLYVDSVAAGKNGKDRVSRVKRVY